MPRWAVQFSKPAVPTASSAGSIAGMATSAPTIPTASYEPSSSPTTASDTSNARPAGAMTDEEMTAYLRDNGYPEHIVRAGRAGLIERWGKFVAEVEHGYRFGLEDYRNDLDLRGIIAMLGLDDEVRDLDRRFEATLTNRDKRVWESTPGNPFWDYGYPSSTGSQFTEDIKKEGLA